MFNIPSGIKYKTGIIYSANKSHIFKTTQTPFVVFILIPLMYGLRIRVLYAAGPTEWRDNTFQRVESRTRVWHLNCTVNGKFDKLPTTNFLPKTLITVLWWSIIGHKSVRKIFLNECSWTDPTMNRDGARVEYRRPDADNNPRLDELDFTRLASHPDDSITGYRSVVSYVVLASSRQHCKDKFQNFKRELRERVKYRIYFMIFELPKARFNLES